MSNPDEPVELLRILVIADVWCQIDGLCAEVKRHLGDRDGDVLVIAPALTGRLHTITGDLDAERQSARGRLDFVVRRLKDHGVAARGEVGDPDPVMAIGDGLAGFAAQKIVVVTETEGHENWRERGLTERLDEAHGVPIHHLTVQHDLAL